MYVEVNNLAACAITNGVSYLIDGKRLKSINQYFNKKMAYLNSLKTIDKLTTKQKRLMRKRNNQVLGYLKNSCKQIINITLGNNVNKIVIGKADHFQIGGIKSDLPNNIKKRINQNFVMIPYGKLRRELQLQCERVGISYVEVDEKYTSIASFLDNDYIPIEYDQNAKFNGIREKRGLYRSKEGIIINADINAAYNMIRKCNPVSDLSHLGSSGLSNPIKLKNQFNVATFVA